MVKIANHFKVGLVVSVYCGFKKLSDSVNLFPADVKPLIQGIFLDISKSTNKQEEIEGLRKVEAEFKIPVTIIDSIDELKYGYIQKIGFNWAVDNNFDAVVLFHGGGYYSPNSLIELIEPVKAGTSDIVIGSRFSQTRSDSRRTMPMYKFFGNVLISKFGNKLTPISLSDWHSGFRIFSKKMINTVPYEMNSDDFIFDIQVLVQAVEGGLEISEVPIPPYSGDIINMVNGMRFWSDIVINVLRYRAHKIGFGSGSTAFNSLHYDLKEDTNASHSVLLSFLKGREPIKILDLGCSDGRLGAKIESLGHSVTGVDVIKLPEVEERITEFFLCDLEKELPKSVGNSFDVVVAADVLEHLRDPQSVIRNLQKVLKPHGQLIISVPNIGHWYGRLKIGLGLFDYDRRGIFDSGHLRFFTQVSFKRMVASAGYLVVDQRGVGLPLSVFERGASNEERNFVSKLSDFVKSVFVTSSNTAIKLWPSLFSYQMVFVLSRSEDLEPNVMKIESEYKLT